MILRNFKVLNTLKQIASATSSVTINTSTLVCKNLNGDSIDKFYLDSRSNYSYSILNYQYVSSVWLKLGSGNTPVTESDYKLDNEITAGIKESTNRKYSHTVESDSIAVDYVYYLKNTSNDTLTIREIGLCSYCYADAQENYLITREVLEEPIVVPAGGYFTIQTGLKFNI